MGERTTLAAVAAQCLQLQTRLDEQDRELAVIRSAVILRDAGPPVRKGFADEWIRQARKQELRVIPGSAKRRTARRGKLRLVS